MAAAQNVFHASYTPAETIELVSRAGSMKGHMRPDRVFILAVSGGGLVAFAGAALLIVTTAPWYAENAPGLLRMFGALIFPIGLVMIILTGAELFTGSTMFTTVAALHGRLSIPRLFMHWFLCFWGNMAGCLFTMVFIFGYGGVFDHEPYKSQVITFVTGKQIDPQFHQIFLRAIGCNWLVCLACYLSMQSKDITAKIFAMWWPLFGFVVLGLDHVVANMFFIPLGLWLGTPNLTVGLFIWKGIIPAGLGNIIGGAGFCGAYYYCMHLHGAPEIKIDGTSHQHHIGGNLFGFLNRSAGDVEHGGQENEDGSRVIVRKTESTSDHSSLS